MVQFKKLLSGNDLRSIGNSNAVVQKVRDQEDFDELFKYLFRNDRAIVMRAADAIEKITVVHPSYLKKYKNAILELCSTATNKELQWHLAQIVPRLNLCEKENEIAWQILSQWALDKDGSKIVRVNAIQALYQMASENKVAGNNFELLAAAIKLENIPSINARIKKLLS